MRTDTTLRMMQHAVNNQGMRVACPLCEHNAVNAHWLPKASQTLSAV